MPGNKLSKQNHAPALPEGDPRPEIMRALMFLNQDIEQEWRALSIEDLLKNAVANWDLQNPAFSNDSR
jgi:glutamyl-Q tRNA(Asp) synthetase